MPERKEVARGGACGRHSIQASAGQRQVLGTTIQRKAGSLLAGAPLQQWP
ncbi:MAG: hypothetical protein NTW21_25485 [Verrucomicrobia bacterium]|nr:hypothetical protein [Verrucomicrobiota bacterium]